MLAAAFLFIFPAAFAACPYSLPTFASCSSKNRCPEGYKCENGACCSDCPKIPTVEDLNYCASFFSYLLKFEVDSSMQIFNEGCSVNKTEPNLEKMFSKLKGDEKKRLEVCESILQLGKVSEICCPVLKLLCPERKYPLKEEGKGPNKGKDPKGKGPNKGKGSPKGSGAGGKEDEMTKGMEKVQTMIEELVEDTQNPAKYNEMFKSGFQIKIEKLIEEGYKVVQKLFNGFGVKLEDVNFSNYWE